METSSLPPEQNSGASSGFAPHSEEEKGPLAPPRVLRRILKESSVQSPLAASASAHDAFERYSGGAGSNKGKGLQKLFFRIYKQKNEILERIRAQNNRFDTTTTTTTPQQEEYGGFICWRGPDERSDRVGREAVKYAWLKVPGRICFIVSSEWILLIECVKPSKKKTTASGFPTSGAFLHILRYNPIDTDYDGNLGIQASTTSTNLGEMTVRINDVPIEINVRVESLPSFAVIEINGSFVFWWRTQEALSFVPKKTRPLKSFLDSQGYENLGAALPDYKRQKLYSNTAINDLSVSVAINDDEESFQSPNRRVVRTESQYTDAAVAAPPPSSSTAAPPNTPNVEITENPPAIPETGPKLVQKGIKVPPKKRAHLIEDHPPRLKEPPSSALLPTPNWKAKLERKLRQHRASQPTVRVPNILDQDEHLNSLGDSALKKSPLQNYRDLTDEEVVKGIATLWTALQKVGKHFAFGSSNTFIGCRTEGFGVDLAVKGPKYPFIMPLIFPPDSDNTEHGMPLSAFNRAEGMLKRPSPGIGHHLLAVARVSDEGFIKVTVLNSLPDYIKQEKIEEVVRSVIKFSGWLGKDQSGPKPLPVWPTVKFEYPIVPTQEGTNTCGLYVILNAWVTMLELEITPTYIRRRLPRKETPYTPFIKALMELINLAISGHVDTETIVAFLVSYGYILEPQPPREAREAREGEGGRLNNLVVPKVNLDQNFNQNLVAQALYEVGRQDTVELNKAVEEQQYIVSADDDEDVQYVIDKTGCTRESAIAAVENSRGVRNIAPFFVPPEQRAPGH